MNFDDGDHGASDIYEIGGRDSLADFYADPENHSDECRDESGECMGDCWDEESEVDAARFIEPEDFHLDGIGEE
jgi:hypothetical protein